MESLGCVCFSPLSAYNFFFKEERARLVREALGDDAIIEPPAEESKESEPGLEGISRRPRRKRGKKSGLG